MKTFLALLVLIPSLALAQAEAPAGGSSVDLTAITSAPLPSTDNSINLGSAAKNWAGIYVGTLYDPAGATRIAVPAADSTTYTSGVTNSTDVVAHIIRSGVTLDQSGSMLLSLRNNNLEVMYVSSGGYLQAIAGVSAPMLGDQQGVARLTMNMFTGNDGNEYKSRVADSGSSISHKFYQLTAQTNASAKLVAIYADGSGTTPVWHVRASGAVQSSKATLPTCNSGNENLELWDGAAGGTTGARSRKCACTSDGGGTPAYAWQNMMTGTVGDATTCNN